MTDPGGPTLRPVRRDDLRPLGSVAGRAFRDDPAFAWFLPDDATRERKLSRFFTLFTGAEHGLDFSDMSTTSDRAAICTWLGPSRWEPPGRRVLWPTLRVSVMVTPAALRRMGAAMSTMRRRHPGDPHWYLSLLAVDPARQRSGIGGALLESGLRRADETRLPAYLETQNEENVAYYRRFGFEVRETLDLPMDGPRVWLMWRHPQ